MICSSSGTSSGDTRPRVSGVKAMADTGVAGVPAFAAGAALLLSSALPLGALLHPEMTRVTRRVRQKNRFIKEATVRVV